MEGTQGQREVGVEQRMACLEIIQIIPSLALGALATFTPILLVEAFLRDSYPCSKLCLRGSYPLLRPL